MGSHTGTGHRAAPDAVQAALNAIWRGPPKLCDPVAFEAWARKPQTHLEGWCLCSIDFAPDGTVWLHATQGDPWLWPPATMEVIRIDADAASSAQ